MKISVYFNLPDFNPNLLDTAIVKTSVRLMKQKYIAYWKNTLQHFQKLEFYRSFKNEHTISNYLDLTRGTAERKALVKLRNSNHKLMIEKGRKNQISRENRHCPHFWSNQIEDEIHFFFHCSKYSL